MSNLFDKVRLLDVHWDCIESVETNGTFVLNKDDVFKSTVLVEDTNIPISIILIDARKYTDGKEYTVEVSRYQKIVRDDNNVMCERTNDYKYCITKIK